MSFRIFLSFLSFILLFSKEVYGQKIDSSIICWSESVKLKWNDFQGQPDTSAIFKGMLAATSASIETFYYEDAGLPNYRISHFFQKQFSWARDTGKLLLIHERLHFDISELYARKIRKGIEDLRKQQIKDVTRYVDLINREFVDKDMKQSQYDKGTHHGAIDILQEEWNKKIKKELELLKKYATTSIDCKGSGGT